jgi:hypothetical protein
MKFLKENLFLIALVAGVAVLGGILTFVNFSLGDEVTTEITKRTDLTGKLRGFTSSGSLVNPGIVGAEANRVRMVLTEANKILQQERKRNEANYPVLLLPVVDANGQTRQQLPAFP